MQTRPRCRFPLAAGLAGVLMLLPVPAPAAREPGDTPASRRTKAIRLDQPIRLTDGVRTVVRTRRELGLKQVSPPGGPPRLSADTAALAAALKRIAPRFRQEAVNARPYVYRGRVAIDPGASSRALDVPTTARRLAAAVVANPAVVRFRITLDKRPPVLTAARLKGITGVLGSFATRASPNAKRDKNIRLAVRSVDGALLSPGEKFSLRETIGKPTQARGYRTAPVFLNAEAVPGIGGGVSQVTGTLFNAAALAGLKIVEVHPHSRPVSYLPVGRDATFAYGSKDLKFTNDTGAPVYIAYSFQGRSLRATLFGRKTPRQKVTLRPRVQKVGAGKINAQLYRVVRQNGKVIAKEQLLGHAYRWDPKSRGV